MEKNISNLKKYNPKNGFSLIELLVVIVIIGVLGAVAIPSYRKYQKNAALNSAIISAKGIFKAVELCLSDGESPFAECTETNIGNSIDQSCGPTLLPETDQKSACQITGESSAQESDDRYCAAVRVQAGQYCVDNFASDDSNPLTGTTDKRIGKKCSADGECVTN